MTSRREFMTGAAGLIGGTLLSNACSQTRSAVRNEEAGKSARRHLALERAQQGILKHRQGEATISVVDQRGRRLDDYSLRITQLTHEFRFGCYLNFRELSTENLTIYQNGFRNLFNYATVGVYWNLIQSVASIADWNQVKPEIEWAASQGLRLKGHPLVWGSHKAGTPTWLPRTKNLLEAALKERVMESVRRQRGRITAWDVVNEPLDGGLFADIIGPEYISQTLCLAREADPQAQLLINEYGILSAQSKRREPYLKLLGKLKDENAPFDAIGIQAHEPRTEWFDPAIVTETLDQFAGLGKQIHLTEFTAPADESARITGGYRQGTWDRRKQAEYFHEFYTICFGHPQVEAITVWGLDDERAWISNCGLLDQKWQHKTAYQALNRLLNHEWRTAFETRVARESHRMRGFYGDYQVKVTLPDKSELTRQFSLRRGESNQWQIDLEKGVE
jgi:GH35 family endo-1,4-beta-xylanase